MTDTLEKRGPLVTVLVPTFNRRRYLFEAVESLVRQTYANFEAFIVNDGGERVDDLVASFNDPRLILLDRRENRGKAFSLNQALQHARGKYVAYLDDDDRYYPSHLARLVDALETDDNCQAAYADLYKVHCRVLPDGRRQVLGKVVNISRDFDRNFICYFNHVLHVSLAHRRDLLDRTGLYNENLRVLIDWDMTRRLAFFTDFHHVPSVTGEFYGPVGACDRISYRMRLDKVEYLKQVLAIRTTRPPKPWPRMVDLSIVFLPEEIDAAVGETLRQIWVWTFVPYEVYLPLPAEQLARPETEMPNIVRVPVAAGLPRHARLDEALRRTQGDFVAIVPPGMKIETMWVEDALYAAANDPTGTTAFALQDAGGDCPGLVMARDVLRRARAGREHLSLADSLREAGIVVRLPNGEEKPFQFDACLQQAQELERDGGWAQAAWLYRQMAGRWANQRWMHENAAWALYRAGGRDRDAAAICREINAGQPTVSTLLLEAKLLRRANDNEAAVALLERADNVLSGKE